MNRVRIQPNQPVLPAAYPRQYRMYYNSAKPSENKAARHVCIENSNQRERARLLVSEGEIFYRTQYVNNLSLSLLHLASVFYLSAYVFLLRKLHIIPLDLYSNWSFVQLQSC